MKLLNSCVILIILNLSILSCKEVKKDFEETRIESTLNKSTDSIKVNNTTQKLNDSKNLKNLLSSLMNIEKTDGKHSDWLTNNNTYFIGHMMEIEQDSFSLKTISYEYKNECVFYLHNIGLITKKASIKPQLEKSQNKYTKGSLEDRILIFTMKNEMEVNFIDIPANWNHIELKNELLELLYSKIDSDVIVCHRADPCEYRDLRKKD
ncbi:hypothetical protein [Cochleicola gelatinilyticus]|uniref:Uncharacterized protein n=1 Tax=Cochleicola gelatinilyticus TaxID=1763537 RepID=A0A167F207_9FLAO|nr:hypothetical protein [Cochleicola gelatinilyticus]OAB76106.1 hypothetical protein ULVI_13695 [Cochleicola gelatinilyticus]